jgi:DUF1365 family protein
MTTDRASALPMLGSGVVRHRRLRPRDNRFEYPTRFVLLPMRELPAAGVPGLPRNRFGLFAFHDADHGDGRPDALAWLDELLATEGVADATGPVWLHTYPRVLGYAFNPVSFWHCHREDGSLAAIVAEVNNTFGERHCYLLAGAGLAYGHELQARKVFHVSPFCRVEGRYRFRFMRTPERLVARIDHDDDAGALLQTSVSGVLEPISPALMRRAFWRQPLLTLAVIARIHWQAVKLWAKRVPFVGKPRPPERFVTR